MPSQLVLSLFPGLGLLDMAFEEEGFVCVQARDRLVGGDHKTFHAPPRRFDGVIGGPPCKRWSQLSHIVTANGYELAPDLIPEYCRIVEEAEPDWFLMENVPAAPSPVVPGYIVRETVIRDHWVGGFTRRRRRFSFGTHDGRRLRVEQLALHTPEPEQASMAGNGRTVPVAINPAGNRKRTAVENGTQTAADGVLTALRHAGLAADFFEQIEADLRHRPWTASGKQSLVGNGVPLSMGRAIARAVKAATTAEATVA